MPRLGVVLALVRSFRILGAEPGLRLRVTALGFCLDCGEIFRSGRCGRSGLRRLRCLREDGPAPRRERYDDEQSRGEAGHGLILLLKLQEGAARLEADPTHGVPRAE